jgi:hypothetical protein
MRKRSFNWQGPRFVYLSLEGDRAGRWRSNLPTCSRGRRARDVGPVLAAQHRVHPLLRPHRGGAHGQADIAEPAVVFGGAICYVLSQRQYLHPRVQITP